MYDTRKQKRNEIKRLKLMMRRIRKNLSTQQFWDKAPLAAQERVIGRLRQLIERRNNVRATPVRGYPLKGHPPTKAVR